MVELNLNTLIIILSPNDVKTFIKRASGKNITQLCPVYRKYNSSDRKLK